MKILETKNLSKHFEGVYAVNGLSLSFEKGLITGIIGPNGSGKSTLTNVLSGMFPFENGEIIVDGVKLNKIKSYELPFFGITRTFQEVRLFEQMTVLDNLLVVLTQRDVLGSLLSKHTDYHIKKAEEILSLVGLLEKKHQLAVNLSYGQRKLLEIGRCLGMNSEIFLFDEPFAGLFAHMTEVVVKIIEQLKQEGKTIILIEHNMELIRKLCDRLFVLDEGKLLAEGKSEQVLNERKVIEAYLGE